MDTTTIQYIAMAWAILGVIMFPILLKIPQPYGRHSKMNWGPLIDNKLGWVIMESPSFIIFVALILFGPKNPETVLWVLFSLWAIHYFNRSFIFPFRTRTQGKKMPVVIMSSAIFFNLVNGFINGYWLARFVPEDKIDFNTDLRVVIGAVVFLIGFIINQYHDSVLINLRKGTNTGYQIPYGGLFRFVSCPNFLGEIITWLGFFIVTQSLPALAFLVWTLANLVPRALDHHKWYRSEFAEYPAKRKAVIPFLV